MITVDPAEFGASREDIRLTLEAENIEFRPVWKPMHLQPVFQGCEVVGGAVAEALFLDGLCRAVARPPCRGMAASPPARLCARSTWCGSSDDQHRVIEVIRGMERRLVE